MYPSIWCSYIYDCDFFLLNESCNHYVMFCFVSFKIFKCQRAKPMSLWLDLVPATPMVSPPYLSVKCLWLWDIYFLKCCSTVSDASPCPRVLASLCHWPTHYYYLGLRLLWFSFTVTSLSTVLCPHHILPFSCHSTKYNILPDRSTLQRRMSFKSEEQGWPFGLAVEIPVTIPMSHILPLILMSFICSCRPWQTVKRLMWLKPWHLQGRPRQSSSLQNHETTLLLFHQT